MDEQRFLKTNEAANYLGVSRSSLTNWIRQGLLKGCGVTPGGHYRFTVEELDAFAKSHGLNPRKENVAPVEPPTELPQKVAKILLVDDDPDFCAYVRDVLTDFKDYELRTAGDGLQGALLVGSWKPDLLILDIRMPNMDGCELLSLIRANPEIAATRVIVASAHLLPESVAEIEKSAPDMILEKPVRLTKFTAAVQKILNLPLA